MRLALLLALLLSRPGDAAGPTREGCQSGALEMCRALAAEKPDDPALRTLDRWACDQGHAPSCKALAKGEKPEQRAADLAVACDAGDLDACIDGATLRDSVRMRGKVGNMASRACAAKDAGDKKAGLDAACDTATRLGWRGAEVRAVQVRPVGNVQVQAVLPGGTLLGLTDEGLRVIGSQGARLVPLGGGPGQVQPSATSELVTLADGRLLAIRKDPLLVWSLLDGRVVRLDVWPAASWPWAVSPDGGAVAAALTDRVGVATWSLPDGHLLGVVPAPDSELLAMALTPGAERLRLRTRWGWTSADPRAQLEADPEPDSPSDSTGPTRGGDLPRPSPDGRLIAIPAPDAVRLVQPDGTEVASISLPQLSGRTLRWSADGGMLAVPLFEGVAVVTTRAAQTLETADDRVIAAIKPAPPMPAEGERAVAPGRVEGSVRLGEAPAAHVQLKAAPCTPGPAPVLAVTDARGHYALEQVAQGCWTFSADGKGGIFADPVRTHVGPTNRVDLGLLATTRATGTLRRSDGQPAAGFPVRARLLRSPPDGQHRQEARVVATATTDARGRFTLDPVPVEGFQIETFLDGEGIVAPWADPAIAQTLDLKPAIAAHLAQDPNGDGQATVYVRQKNREVEVEAVLESDGTWISTDFTTGQRVQLSVHQAQLSTSNMTVTVPVQQEIQLQGPAYGRLRVRLPGRTNADRIRVKNARCEPEPDGCLTPWIPVHHYPVYVRTADGRMGVGGADLQPGVTTELAAPLSEHPAALVGRVVDATGTPLAGVQILLRSGAQFLDGDTRTGPDGRFRLTGLLSAHELEPFIPTGIEAIAVLEGWTPSVQDVALSSGSVEDLGDVTLHPEPPPGAETAWQIDLARSLPRLPPKEAAEAMASLLSQGPETLRYDALVAVRACLLSAPCRGKVGPTGELSLLGDRALGGWTLVVPAERVDDTRYAFAGVPIEMGRDGRATVSLGGLGLLSLESDEAEGLSFLISAGPGNTVRLDPEPAITPYKPKGRVLRFDAKAQQSSGWEVCDQAVDPRQATEIACHFAGPTSSEPVSIQSRESILVAFLGLPGDYLYRADPGTGSPLTLVRARPVQSQP